LDSEIIQEHEITNEAGVNWPKNSFVVMGRLDNSLIRDILAQARTPIGIKGNNLTLNGYLIRIDSHTGGFIDSELMESLTATCKGLYSYTPIRPPLRQ
jgi:hypothetical protein